MAQYITKKCNNCGYIIQRKIYSGVEVGVPFTKCPRCGEYQIDRNKKEYIMFNLFDYFSYFIYLIAAGTCIGLFVGLLIWGSVDETNYLLLWLPFFLVEGFFIYLGFKGLNKDKEKSIERTKDKDYLELLLKHNLISEKKYNTFIERYNLNEKTKTEKTQECDRQVREVIESVKNK